MSESIGPEITSEMLLAAKRSMKPLEAAYPYLLWYYLPILDESTWNDVVYLIVQHKDFPRKDVEGGRYAKVVCTNGHFHEDVLRHFCQLAIPQYFGKDLPAAGWDCTGRGESAATATASASS